MATEYPNRHPGAPLTIWLRPSRTLAWHETRLDPPEPDAVEYIRKDVCDAMLTEASRQPHAQSLREAMRGTSAELILREALEKP